MRRFVNGNRFWEIELDGRFVITRHGTRTGKPREDRRFCKAGAKAYFDERVGKRMGEPGWIEDRPAPPIVLDLEPRVVGLVGAVPWERVAGPGPRADADRPVGVALARVRETTGNPEAVAAVALDALDVPSAATLLSVVPNREAADLVVGRLGLVGLVRAILAGTWRLADGVAIRSGARTRSDLPPWLTRARELSRCVPRADLDAAVAAIADHPEADAWRLLDTGFVVPEADRLSTGSRPGGFGAMLLERFRPSLPRGASHLAALLDPEGWGLLPKLLSGDGGARWFTVAPWLSTLIARHGAAALPIVRDDVELLRCIHHPDTARTLIGALGRDGAEARHAALIAMAPFTLRVLATDGARTEATRELVRELVERPGLVDAVLPTLEPAARKRLQGWAKGGTLPIAETLPERLAGRPTGLLPRWLQLARLPTLITADGEAAYPAAARARAIELLAGDDPAALRDLRDLCDGASLGAFVLGLVDQYAVHATTARTAIQRSAEKARILQQESRFEDVDEHGEGELVRRRPTGSTFADLSTPEDESWVLRAAATCGDAGTVRGLALRVRSWPPILWQLAGEGVDAIAAIQDPSSLVELGSLARRGPGAVRKRATLRLQTMALRTGLDEASLDEILLPDLGLDARGTLVLDYGPRSFTVGFDAELVPFVRDAEGNDTASLPRPRKTDDADKAAAAGVLWTTLKKDVRTVRTTLVRRLEDGLRRERLWPARHFRNTLATHPFARHVASRLLWSCDDRLFRLDEEGLPVDLEHQPVPLSGRIGLVHPLWLDDETRGRWSAMFADYEIVQPFDQLGRAIHRADPAKDGGEWLPRLAGSTFRRGRLFALQQRGWRWVAPRAGDGTPGPLVALIADWAGGGITAHLVPVDPTGEEVEEVTVQRVTVPGSRWLDVDPVTFSEVVRDLGP